MRFEMGDSCLHEPADIIPVAHDLGRRGRVGEFARRAVDLLRFAHDATARERGLGALDRRWLDREPAVAKGRSTTPGRIHPARGAIGARRSGVVFQAGGSVFGVRVSSEGRSAGPRSVTSPGRPRAPAVERVRRRVLLLVFALVASLGLSHVLSLPRSALSGDVAWGWLAAAVGGCSFVLGAALLVVRYAIQPELDALEQARRDIDARDASALGAAEATNAYLRDVSHEMRASMHAVLGLGQLLGRSPLDATQHRQVRTLDGAARALLRIMNDLLALSGPEPHRFEVVPMGCSLHELLRVSADLLEPAATDKGLALDLCIAAELPDKVLTDAGRVQQVVLGVCRHAIELSEQGRLRIDARAKNLGAQRFDLWLRVEGSRASSEQAGKGPSTPEADEQGAASAAGLSLSQRLVAILGGSIQRSDARGLLEVSIPMARIDLVGGESSAPPRVSPVPASIRLPPTVSPILVVEPDEQAQTEVAELLENLGFDVELVADATPALERAERTKYALIALATDAPELDAPALARQLRRRLGAERPSILGLSREPLVVARQRAGADQFEALVSKPLKRSALSLVLAQWLEDEAHPASSGMRLTKIGALERATRRARETRASSPPVNGVAERGEPVAEAAPPSAAAESAPASATSDRNPGA